MPMLAEAAWPAALGLLGAIIGSFVATLAIRWPAGRSITVGRSACDTCGQVVPARDLVPLASFVVLRGRCRGCRQPIDRHHPAIELIALLIGAAAGFAAPGPLGVAGAMFGWLLLALAALDVVALWLPDRLTATVAVSGLLAGAAGLPPALGERAIGGAGGFAALALIAIVYRRVRGREGLGGGDPKLLGAIGCWLGWQLVPAVLLLACLVGLGVALVQRLGGRAIAADTAMPLGALLAIAAYPAWLAMVAWRP